MTFLIKCFAIFLIVSNIESSLASNDLFIRNSAHFASNIYQTSIEYNEGQNFVMSPLSVHTALGLLYIGAHGQTALELAEGLSLPTVNKTTVLECFKEVLASQDNNPSLGIANKIYTKSGYSIKPIYNNYAKDYFRAEIDSLNFADNVQSALIINEWVAQHTYNKINNLISPADLNENTQMVLINGVHFKGSWENKFNPILTRKSNFWHAGNQSVEVDVMVNKIPCESTTSKILESKILLLPYAGSNLKMMIILPNDREGLDHLEKNLNKVNILDFLRNTNYEEHIIKIPKFKIEFSIELNEVLSRMGMQSIFTNSAKLFESNEPLKITKVVHKAFIEVNEEGTEAAGATGIASDRIAGGTTPKFVADHPFFFAIVSNESVLFTGRIKSFS